MCVKRPHCARQKVEKFNERAWRHATSNITPSCTLHKRKTCEHRPISSWDRTSCSAFLTSDIIFLSHFPMRSDLNFLYFSPEIELQLFSFFPEMGLHMLLSCSDQTSLSTFSWDQTPFWHFLLRSDFTFHFHVMIVHHFPHFPKIGHLLILRSDLNWTLNFRS